MWYHNKLGHAFWLEHAIAYYNDTAVQTTSNILVDIEIGSKIKTYLIEDLDVGTPNEFINWIVTFFRMRKEILTWEDYLEFRDKVLSTMKENSINWEDYEKEKEGKKTK